MQEQFHRESSLNPVNLIYLLAESHKPISYSSLSLINPAGKRKNRQKYTPIAIVSFKKLTLSMRDNHRYNRMILYVAHCPRRGYSGARCSGLPIVPGDSGNLKCSGPFSLIACGKNLLKSLGGPLFLAYSSK